MFGTVRPRVQIPGPRPVFELRILNFAVVTAARRSQGGHRFSENFASKVAKWSRWSADLNSADSDLVGAHGCISVDAFGKTVRHLVRKSQAGVRRHMAPDLRLNS